MPALSNVRHERFARAWIKTGVAAQAYAKAGYQPTTPRSLYVASSRLLTHVDVQRRIRELKKQMATRNRITVDSLVAELDEARTLALSAVQPSAAISATISKAKLVGLLVERKETGQPGEFAGLQSEADVLALVKSEMGEKAAQQLAQALAAADEPEENPSAPEEIDPLPIDVTNEGSGTLQ